MDISSGKTIEPRTADEIEALKANCANSVRKKKMATVTNIEENAKSGATRPASRGECIAKWQTETILISRIRTETLLVTSIRIATFSGYLELVA